VIIKNVMELEVIAELGDHSLYSWLATIHILLDFTIDILDIWEGKRCVGELFTERRESVLCRYSRDLIGLDLTEALAPFLDRVRDAVIRLRQGAILNDDLATVIAEIETLDALLPSLGDASDIQVIESEICRG
jgi:hypothetical protein